MTSPFHSALLVTIERSQSAPRCANAEQWRGWLDGAQRRGEIKQAERDWIEIDHWLGQQNGLITREAVTNYVVRNQVRVEDVLLGGESSYDAFVARMVEKYGPRWQSQVSDQEADEIEALPAEERVDTKYSRYSLSGGNNYRELLLTLPVSVDTTGWHATVGSPGVHAHIYRVFDAAGALVDNPIAKDPEQAIKAAARTKRDELEKGGFVSRHWNGMANILAHVRFDERFDMAGNRLLFIEEIQSDWHQEGRKRGYEVERTQAEREAILHRNAQATTLAEVDIDVNEPAIPDAPFKKTSEWTMLAFRRMVVWAAEHGFDRIGWTTGEQQAQRFGLNKVFSRIDWLPASPTKEKIALTLEITGHGMQTAYVDRNTGRVTGGSGPFGEIAGRGLADLIGHEVARKVLANERGGLTNEDLEKGGSGLKAFYDQILPSAVGRWARKFGASVDQSCLPLFSPSGSPIIGASGSQVHSLEITPDMREAALAGLPLFKRQPPVEAQDDDEDEERPAFRF